MDDNEYGEFTKGVVMEFTQSITLKEAKNLKSPGNLMRYEHVSEFVAKYSMSTIREQAVETDVYQLSNSFETIKVAAQKNRAIFRVVSSGAVDIEVSSTKKASVMIFSWRNIGAYTRRLLAAYTLGGNASTSQEQIMTPAPHLTNYYESGKHDILISIWTEPQAGIGNENQSDASTSYITCRAGSHFDRHACPYGGYWFPYVDSPHPLGPEVAFVWLVPKENIATAIVNVLSLVDDRLDLIEQWQKDSAKSDWAAVLSIAIGAASLMGGIPGTILGIVGTGTSVSGFFFSLSSSSKSELFTEIATYKKQLCDQIKAAAGWDEGNAASSPCHNGVKLTFYKYFQSQPKKIKVESWDGEVMTGAPGYLGAFMPVQADHFSTPMITLDLVKK